MLTRYDTIFRRAGGLLAALGLVLGFCALIATDAYAQPAPPNNNVTNAQGINGSSGTIFGTNLYVVAQTNAPAGDPFPAQYSIWYEWTAPITSMMDFNTRDSVDINGNPMDTVLVIYALKSGTTNYAWTNLTAVATNDDDSNTNWGVTSRDSFQANIGSVYIIQIDGSQKSTPGASAQGYPTLNWQPSLVGGGFGFSSSYFAAGSLDDYIEFNDGSITPSIYGHPAGDANVRVTVTRTGGYTGKCEVTLIVTNNLYTNVYQSEATGTNIYITNYTDGTLTTVKSYTNIFLTNEISYDLYANDFYGAIEYLPLDELIFASQTNTSFNPNTLVNYANVSLGTFGLVDFFTNFPCPPNFTLTSGAVSNADGTYTVALTNIFCTNFTTNVAVPAALAGIQYTPYSNTLVFKDFQMSQDVFLQVDPLLGSYPPDSSPLDCPVPGPEDYFYVQYCTNIAFENSDPGHIYPGLNSSVLLILTNVVLDSNEDLDIIPPTIQQQTADLNILNYWGNPSPVYTNSAVGDVVMNFERETFRCNRNAGTAILWVQRYPRLNASSYTLHYSIDTQPANLGVAVLDWNNWTPVAGADYAVPYEGQAVYDFTLPITPDWTGLSGELTFPQAPNRAPQPIEIPIVNNGSQEFDEDIYVELYQTDSDYKSDISANPPGYLGNLYVAHLTINFDNTSDNLEPGGAVDRTWNYDNSATSQLPGNPFPGAQGGAGAAVQAIAIQPNDAAIVGGYFNSFNEVTNFNIVRLKSNGFIDTTFNTGSGINNGSVYALAVDPSGRVLVGGSFNSYNGQSVGYGLCRLLSNGALDTTFKAGIGFTGPDGQPAQINALCIDANSNILVAGSFIQYNTTNCANLVRLLPTGGLDTNFYPNMGNGLTNYGTDLPINTVKVDYNQNVVIGGQFQYVNGVPRNYLARLLTNGVLDTSFDPGVGPDEEVNSLDVATNNEVLIGGMFQNYSVNSRNYVALVNTNGTLDTTFTTGTGANAPVYSVVFQTNGQALIGGQFTSYNETRRIGLARLLPQGWLDTSFMDTSYNQFAGIINDAYITAPNTIYAMALESSGNILVGGQFTQLGGGSARDDYHPRANVARVIGAPTAGPETGGIGNYPGNVTFAENIYDVLDTYTSDYIILQRTNGSLGPIAVTLATNTFPPGPGAATAQDFGLNIDTPIYRDIWDLYKNVTASTYGWRKSDGYSGLNNIISPQDRGNSGADLFIYNDPSAASIIDAGLSLLNINSYGLLSLGGVPIPTAPALGTPSATLNIINNNLPIGVVGFNATAYTALNTSNQVTITVVRTNGTQGSISVNYATANGTARAGTDYTTTSGKITFPQGISTASFNVKISATQSRLANGSIYFNVSLNTPSTNSIIDTNTLPTTAQVNIIDGSFTPGHLNFTSSNFVVLKGGLATASVQRTAGAVGVLQVQVGTSDGTGVNGLNYTGITNTLIWSNQDVSTKTITIQTLHDSTVEGTKTVNLSLFNATNIGNSTSNNLILNSPSNASLAILDTDSYGSVGFASPNFNIFMNAAQALVTVVRTNGVTGTVQVGFTTINNTNAVLPYLPAYVGTNYGQTNGILVFGPNVTSQSFVVPIYNTGGAESTYANRQVTLELFAISNSPAANSNQFPIFSTLTILDTNILLGSAGSIDLTTENGTGFNNVVSSLALQPDGSILAAGSFSSFNSYPFNNIARLLSTGTYDTGFSFNLPGPNSNVFQILDQPQGQSNGPIMIVGNFSQINGVNRSGVARLVLAGTLDIGFNPGAGANGPVMAMAPTIVPTVFNNNVTNIIYTQAYYVGGNFGSYDGVNSVGIARVNAATNSPGLQGTPDSTFNIGLGVTSGNATVRALAVQPNNQLVAGGDFTSFNGQTNNHLVRLNPDGTVDTSFNPSTGSDPSQTVRATLVQPDGKILIGGSFTNVNGSGYNYLARLNTDGTIDTNFNIGVGGNNDVLALALDTQQRILVGGTFSKFSGVSRAGITRLNPDGTVDPTINFGSAADGGFIDTIAVQTNDEIDLGGGFSTFEGAPENNFVRVYGGANFGSGAIQFTVGQYGILQNGTNLVITLQRTGGEGTLAQSNASVVFSTQDGTAVAGVDYVGVTNTVTFPYGETFEQVTVPIIYSTSVANNKYFILNLSDPVFATVGAEIPSAIVTITNVNAAVNFSAQSYPVYANVPGGNAIIPILRTGDPASTLSVTVYTGTNGTATAFTNYIPTTNVITFNPGVTTQNFLIPILNATNMFGNQTVDLELSNPSNVFLGAPSSATLTIDAVQNAPGYLAFSQTNYVVSEGATNAVITVVRTNGTQGQVSIVLTTSNGTAISGVNYQSVRITNTFADGSSTPQYVYIPVYQQPAAGPDTTVFLTLSNPTGNEGLPIIGGTNQEVLTIQNNFEDFFITNSPYFVGEGQGSVTVGIVRAGPLTNQAAVTVSTFTPPNTTEAEGYAQAGVDYQSTSNTLIFNPNVSYETFSIPIIAGDTAPTNGPLTFEVQLSTPTNLNSANTNIQIGIPGTAPVTILGDVTGFQLTTNSYVVGENSTNLLVWVTRLNPGTNVTSVRFGTTDGTALNQVDYLATNGTLVFSNGMISNSFSVPIINQNVVENTKSFSVYLTNALVLTGSPSNAFVVPPSTASVTITNVLTGVSFSSSSYSVSECAGIVSIPVILTGATNNGTNFITFSTSDGSGVAGSNYVSVSESLEFLPGQTETNATIQIINNNVIGPDHTVVLTLSDPTGSALLLNPSTAVLTIRECNGSYIVKAGTSFISGTFPGNVPATSSVIFSNETVSLLFGLRDAAGNTTTNLVATLLATNGVTNVSGPQNYGALAVGGPTVSRPFTFTATGTNGQNIIANFTLKDGSQIYSNVAFGFTLGGNISLYSTNEVLYLYGSNSPPSKAYNSNPPNFGYPSVINIAGVVGALTSVSASVSNFGHSYPADVSMMLVGPTGKATYLMNDCGYTNAVSHINMTFSQTASGPLPEYSPGITSTNGAYLPTVYTLFNYPQFPSNQIGLPSPPLPSTVMTNLNTFVGTSPNGAWSLFVADENTLDHGYISNGWSLSLGTGIPVEQDADLELGMTVSPAAATLSNSVVYTINLTNYGPSAATNVLITDVLPAGSVYVANNCNCAVTTNGILTYAIPTLATNVPVSFTVTVTPTNLGYITNIASAVADQPNPTSNNVQTNIQLVSAESADMGVSLTGNPNPVIDGGSVTYSILVTNNGPSFASGVTAVDVLPSGFLPSAITPSNGMTLSTNASAISITWNLGVFQANASQTLTIVAGVAVPTNNLPSSANLDSVSVSAQTYDPAKLNNYAAIKTEVEPMLLTLVNLTSKAMLAWSSTSGIVLQGATNLPSSPTSPDWVSITNSSQIIQQKIGNQMQSTYNLPTNSGFHFFRLRSQLLQVH